MPSDLTLLGVAVISAAGGVGGSHLRAAVEARRLRAERDAARFDHRQDNYHHLIDASDELRDYLRPGGPEEISESEFNNNLRALRHFVRGVSVFATDEVRRAARALLAEHEAGSRPDELDRLREELIDAMRQDVAPKPKRR